MASIYKRGDKFQVRFRRQGVPYASAIFSTREEAEHWAQKMEEMADAVAAQGATTVFSMADSIMQKTGRGLPEILQEALFDLCQKLGVKNESAAGSVVKPRPEAIQAEQKVSASCAKTAIKSKNLWWERSPKVSGLKLDKLGDVALSNWFQMVKYDLFKMLGPDDEVDFSNKEEAEAFSKAVPFFRSLLEAFCVSIGSTANKLLSGPPVSFPFVSIEEVAESEGLSVAEFVERIGEDYPYPVGVEDDNPAYLLLQFAAIRAGVGSYLAENASIFGWYEKLADLAREEMDRRSPDFYRESVQEYLYNLTGGKDPAHLDWLNADKLFWLNDEKVERFPHDLFDRINKGDPVPEFAGRNILAFEIDGQEGLLSDFEFRVTPIPIRKDGRLCYRLFNSGCCLRDQIEEERQSPLVSHQDAWSGSLQAKEFLGWISNEQSVVNRIGAAIEAHPLKK